MTIQHRRYGCCYYIFTYRKIIKALRKGTPVIVSAGGHVYMVIKVADTYYRLDDAHIKSLDPNVVLLYDYQNKSDFAGLYVPET
jgi:hypothetical protein